MIRNERGFNLIEILIAIAILGLVMAMNSQLLQDLVRGQARQASLVSSQFETSLGLEMMRNDISNAGFGLADEFRSAPGTYTEASTNPAQTFNDTPNVPKAIAHSNDVGTGGGHIGNSDYLVIRSPAVGLNPAAGKWTNITGSNFHLWNDPNLDLVNNQDYVVIVKPRTASGGRSQLIVSAGAYAPIYTTGAVDAAFQPAAGTGERFLAFGVDTVAPRMPFNRADFYVRQGVTNNPNCVPGTGTLVKRIELHAGGSAEYALVECVANMQIVFRLDTNLDGIPDQTVNNISGLDALALKEQIKEVQVYVLAHEGGLDRSFTYGGVNPVILGPTAILGTSVGLAAYGADWNHYRWKVLRITVKPRSFY